LESLTHNQHRSSCLSYRAFIKQLQALTRSKKILIAYSGGLDSHALLHLASQASQANNFQVRAIHIHHGLQEVANEWIPHCQHVCDELNIPLIIQYLNLTLKKGKSLEEIARNARYAAFVESLEKDEILLTAHHQNDQAETLLLQLFRGAGVQGLAAMPSIVDFGLGQHIRPLLDFSRKSLETYAKENKLDFIEDPSNQDTVFDRNFLRNKILPELRKRWPSIDKTISRSASIQAETKQLLDEYAEQDLLSIQSDSSSSKKLNISKLQIFSMARQKLVVRYWILSNGFKPPSEKKLKHIFTDVIDAGEDTQPLVEWRGVEVRRYKDELYIMKPLQDHNNNQVIEWGDPQSSLNIKSLDYPLPALSASQYDKNIPVTVRFRQGGEKFYHPKRGIKLSLKNYLNESNVPPWLRSRIPLVYSGETLIKVVGLE